MVNLIEKDGTVIAEIKVQTRAERLLVDELRRLNMNGKSEAEYWDVSKKVHTPSLDDKWKPVTEDMDNPFDRDDDYGWK